MSASMGNAARSSVRIEDSAPAYRPIGVRIASQMNASINSSPALSRPRPIAARIGRPFGRGIRSSDSAQEKTLQISLKSVFP
jgi:hypothetical protein